MTRANAEMRPQLSEPFGLADPVVRGLVEAIPDAVVLVDDAGRIVLVNAHTERMFGYRRDELIGQTVELLVPQRFRASHAVQRAAYALHPEVRPMGANRELYGRDLHNKEILTGNVQAPSAAAKLEGMLNRDSFRKNR